MVLRFMKDGTTGNARPCFNCLQMMRDIGINKVYYSTGDDNSLVCESVKDMVSIQSSSVARYCYHLQTNLIFTKDEYFEDLIKKLFPKYIKENNLNCFLEYNFKNVLPDYNFLINNKTISFYNKDNKILLVAYIV
jgi:hypothetical protein